MTDQWRYLFLYLKLMEQMTLVISESSFAVELSYRVFSFASICRSLIFNPLKSITEYIRTRCTSQLSEKRCQSAASYEAQGKAALLKRCRTVKAVFLSCKLWYYCKVMKLSEATSLCLFICPVFLSKCYMKWRFLVITTSFACSYSYDKNNPTSREDKTNN